MALKLQRCAADCGWLFVAYRVDARYCNECGDNEYQPRICKVGADETDAATLLRLAKYALRWWMPGTNLHDLVNERVNSAIEAVEDPD